MSQVSKDDFNKELLSCIDSKIISELLGAMFLTLIDNAVHSKALSSFNDDVINEAKGFALDHVISKFMAGKKAKKNGSNLAFYFTIISNYLRTFKAKRLGSSAIKDIYGQNITVRSYPVDVFPYKALPATFYDIDDYMERMEGLIGKSSVYIFAILHLISIKKYAYV